MTTRALIVLLLACGQGMDPQDAGPRYVGPHCQKWEAVHTSPTTGFNVCVKL